MSISNGSDITAADGKAMVEGTFSYAASVTGTDAYAATIPVTSGAYAVGAVYKFKADVANTAAATFNVSGFGALSLKKYAAGAKVALDTGDIIANQFVACIYDGTDLVIISPLAAHDGVYSNGQVAMNGASTQTIAHGLGRVPKRVRIFANATTDTAQYYAESEGVYDASGQSCRYLKSNSNVSTITPATVGSKALFLEWTSATKSTSGVVSVDATNITLTYTYGGGGHADGQLVWEAEA